MALDISMVYSYYEVIHMIVEEEQSGKQRLEYIPKTRLDRKCLPIKIFIYMRVHNIGERYFYEIEAARNGWGVKELGWQHDRALYE